MSKIGDAYDRITYAMNGECEKLGRFESAMLMSLVGKVAENYVDKVLRDSFDRVNTSQEETDDE